MSKLVSIITAAEAPGISTGTSRLWDASGRLAPALGVCYPRQSWACDTIADLGSGINYRKWGLKRLLDGIVEGEVGRLVSTHKDQLLRFGAELVFALCQAKQVEVVIINGGEDTTFEEELANDVLENITVFSARRYGSRSHRNQKLIDGMRTAVRQSQCT